MACLLPRLPLKKKNTHTHTGTHTKKGSRRVHSPGSIAACWVTKCPGTFAIHLNTHVSISLWSASRVFTALLRLTFVPLCGFLAENRRARWFVGKLFWVSCALARPANGTHVSQEQRRASLCFSRRLHRSDDLLRFSLCASHPFFLVCLVFLFFPRGESVLYERQTDSLLVKSKRPRCSDVCTAVICWSVKKNC